MATYYFKGKAMWAKVDTPVPNYAKDGHQWEISLIMDEDSEQMFKDSGLSLRPNKKDGSIRFKRPTAKLIKGETKQFGPPTVLDKDGLPFSKKIGNDSVVIVKVDVYNTMRGKGHQLEGVKIEELVEFGDSEVVAAEDVVPF